MRRLVAALVIASIAVMLAACGGGGGTATTEAAVPAAAAPAAAPVPAANTAGSGASNVTSVSATNKLSPQEAGVGAPFPSQGKQVPADVVEHIAKHEPMLLFFYDPEQTATADQRAQIEAAVAQYRGMIEYIDFDVTGALPDPVTKMPRKSEIGEQVALLVQDLKIGYTPYVILVDRQGIMSARYRGFVDRALLEREIIKATQ